MQEDVILSVSDFVASLNQTLEFAYPSISIQGELANFRVSKNRWVYFDLKDELASVKFFGTVYNLPGPLEDGMMLQVRGMPRLHQLYGFSVNVQTIQPVGEGSIKKAAALLEAKLTAEGLFDPERKRPLPYPPKTIGLIASGESAAYHDFIKIMNERWNGVDIALADVQVQGEVAPAQIVNAIQYFNSHHEVDVIVITRGGGSAEDLSAFSTEQVTRAVAASRIPTIVAIGHEVDISLAELAADQRASTPSNAAQLLVPDKRHVLEQLGHLPEQLFKTTINQIKLSQDKLSGYAEDLFNLCSQQIQEQANNLKLKKQLIEAFNPSAALKRGYAIVRFENEVMRSGKNITSGQDIAIELTDSVIDAKVTNVNVK
jgi:exodeoxyribonuclease VII large subunit